MDEKKVEAVDRLAAAAEALERTVAKLEARFAVLEEKVDRIVAMVEEKAQLSATKEDGRSVGQNVSARKTMSASAGALLEKGGERAVGTGSLDSALRVLSVEQRIAVKAELARAGLLS